MQNLLIILTLLGLVENNSCQYRSRFFLNKIPEGYYVGGDKVFKSVFVKVANDIIVADYIYTDKFPRNLATDTLIYDDNSSIAKGKFSTISNENGKWYIISNHEIFSSKINIKVNTKYYQASKDKNKNIAFLNKKYREDILQNNIVADSIRFKYESLKKDFNLDEKKDRLSFEEFLKEYEKFETELLMLINKLQ